MLPKQLCSLTFVIHAWCIPLFLLEIKYTIGTKSFINTWQHTKFWTQVLGARVHPYCTCSMYTFTIIQYIITVWSYKDNFSRGLILVLALAGNWVNAHWIIWNGCNFKLVEYSKRSQYRITSHTLQKNHHNWRSKHLMALWLFQICDSKVLVRLILTIH